MPNFIQGAIGNALKIQANPASLMQVASSSLIAGGNLALKLTALIDAELKQRDDFLIETNRNIIAQEKNVETARHNMASEANTAVSLMQADEKYKSNKKDKDGSYNRLIENDKYNREHDADLLEVQRERTEAIKEEKTRQRERQNDIDKKRELDRQEKADKIQVAEDDKSFNETFNSKVSIDLNRIQSDKVNKNRLESSIEYLQDEIKAVAQNTELSTRQKNIAISIVNKKKNAIIEAKAKIDKELRTKKNPDKETSSHKAIAKTAQKMYDIISSEKGLSWYWDSAEYDQAQEWVSNNKGILKELGLWDAIKNEY